MHNSASLRRGAKALWVLGWVVIAVGLVSAVSGAFRTAELMERMGPMGGSANAADWANAAVGILVPVTMTVAFGVFLLAGSRVLLWLIGIDGRTAEMLREMTEVEEHADAIRAMHEQRQAQERRQEEGMEPSAPETGQEQPRR